MAEIEKEPSTSAWGRTVIATLDKPTPPIHIGGVPYDEYFRERAAHPDDITTQVMDRQEEPAAARAARIAEQQKGHAVEIEQARGAVKLEADMAKEPAVAMKARDEDSLNEYKSESSWSDSYPAIFLSHAKDFLIDAPVSGTTHAVNETAIAATELVNTYLPIPAVIAAWHSFAAGQSGTEVVTAWKEGDAQVAEWNDGMRQSLQNNTVLNPNMDNPPAHLAAGMVQFLEGFLPISRAVSGAGKVSGLKAISARSVESAYAAALTSGIVWNPDDPNLANLLESVGDGKFSNAVTRMLATVPGDSSWDNRVRNAASEMFIGPIADAFVQSLRFAKQITYNKWAAARTAKLTPDARTSTPIVPDTQDVVTARIIATDKELRSRGPEGVKMADERLEPGFDNLKVDEDGGSILITAEAKVPRAAIEDAPVHADSPPNPNLGLDANLNGKLELQARGDKLQVINAQVHTDLRGEGNGIKLYDEARRIADERGVTLVSDTSVSEDAARVWVSMGKQGDNIRDQRITNPDNVYLENGQWHTKNNTPVFERVRGGVEVPPANPVVKELKAELAVLHKAGSFENPRYGELLDEIEKLEAGTIRTLYHVSGAPKDTILQPRVPESAKGPQPEGLYFSTNRLDVADYRGRAKANSAEGKATVREMLVDTREFVDVTEAIEAQRAAFDPPMSYGDAKKIVVEAARESGAPGVTFRGNEFNRPEVTVFDADKILRGNGADLTKATPPAPPRPPPSLRAGAEIDTGPQRTDATPDDTMHVDPNRVKLTHESIREHFQEVMTPEQRQALIEKVSRGDYLGDDMSLFNSSKFDFGDVTNEVELRQILSTIEELTLDAMEASGRKTVITHAQTLQHAADIGMSAEQAHQLAQDVIGGGAGAARLSARMMAAHQTMVAHGKYMLAAMEKARRTGNLTDQVAASNAIEMQAAIMAEVKGSSSEVARALNAMKLRRAATAESFAALESAAREFGVRSELINGLLAGKTDLAALNAAADRASRATIPEMISELAVAGLLTNPTTHVVNIASNTSMLTIIPYERFMAATIGTARRALGLGLEEQFLLKASGRNLLSYIRQFPMALKMAGKAFWEGAPITDVKQRVEVAARPRISSNSLGLDGTKALGKLVDNVIAPAIRSPFRLLGAEDELFKHLHFRSEIASLAYETAVKHADAQGLTGVARDAFIKSREGFLMNNPTVKMQRDAIEVARLGTFQESPRTVAGPAMEKLINIHPFVKLIIAPFLRTPTNILRQTFIDRVPILNLFVKSTREAIVAGGKEGDLALARTTTGMAALTTGYLMVNSWSGPDKNFEVVGKRPYDTSGRLDNVEDYSFRVNDTWYRFNRFDPIGSWLGFSADYRSAMNDFHDPADPDAEPGINDMIFAGMGAMTSNALNKVWLKSLADIVDSVQLMGEGGPGAGMAAQKLAGDQIIKLIPFSSLSRAISRDMDPIQREAWTVADRVMNALPGQHDGLAPKRDELGRILDNKSGVNFLFNPFAATQESSDPLDQELARLDFAWPRLGKSLDNGQIPLNTQQYSRFKELIGQVPPAPGYPNLEEALRGLIANEMYLRSTTSIRVDLIQQTRDAYKSIAEQKLRQEYPDLQERWAKIFVYENEEATGRRLENIRQILGVID